MERDHVISAREAEDNSLASCAAAAQGLTEVARDRKEANVFRIAGMVVQSRFPSEAVRLMQASEKYFQRHPYDKLPAADVVRNGRVFGLPRLRDMLSLRLAKQPA